MVIIYTTIFISLSHKIVDAMFVCLCKGVTDTQIKQSIQEGTSSSLKDIRRELGVATQCCKCLPEARVIVEQELSALAPNNIAASSDLYYSA